ncbi:MAG: GNAT family N-acetyltransferase [Clostridia bacterium]|nr:GNAT family N-acetyltransferase [Clostridia bacterium]
MNWILKHFSELSNRELYEILRVRVSVFVVEQTCPYQEIDEADFDAYHLFLPDESGHIRAYLRIFEKDADFVRLGRILTTERGTGLGLKLIFEGMRVSEALYGRHRFYVEAQSYAIGFYEKAGFRVVSEEFLEDGIPHVKMETPAVVQ